MRERERKILHGFNLNTNLKNNYDKCKELDLNNKRFFYKIGLSIILQKPGLYKRK